MQEWPNCCSINAELKLRVPARFLRPYLHQVVAISALWWQGDQVKLSSFGAIEDPEATLVHAFFSDDSASRSTVGVLEWCSL
ncbi:3'-5' exonuclease [Acidithiobacillus thiooxidans]|uniref:3'-5' exonuclease n=1 Tax=Acidithiobacillus thiooxidans TaxID=930 RepID=UPI001ED9B828|nr:3'-5' exonuclease [Acidithiobacillus thiooxidans]